MTHLKTCVLVFGRCRVRSLTRLSVILTEVCRSFSQSLQASVGIVPPQATPVSFQRHSRSSVISSFEVVQYGSVTVSLNKQQNKKQHVGYRSVPMHSRKWTDIHCVRFEVLTAAMLRIQVLWDVTPCLWVSTFRFKQSKYSGLFDPEYGGNPISRNVGNYLSKDTASYPRRVASSFVYAHVYIYIYILCFYIF